MPTCPARITLFPITELPAKSGLRTDQRVFLDCAGMTDLDEIINFRAAFDDGFADRSAVNRRVCTDLDIIFQIERARPAEFSAMIFLPFSRNRNRPNRWSYCYE